VHFKVKTKCTFLPYLNHSCSHDIHCLIAMSINSGVIRNEKWCHALRKDFENKGQNTCTNCTLVSGKNTEDSDSMFCFVS
jgi:hypothetical protein